MEERDFFLEARIQRPATLHCPFCRAADEHQLNWVVRKKKTNINLARLDDRERMIFEKAQSYMVLQDDHAQCARAGCGRRFEISGVKTMAFVTPEQLEEVSFRDDRRDYQRPRGQGQGYGQGGNRGYGNQRQGQGYGQGQENRGGGNRTQYGKQNQGNKQGQGNRQGQQGGQQGGQPNRRDPQQQPYSPSQWSEQQGLRSPRGKRSDPTGPGGGWH